MSAPSPWTCAICTQSKGSAIHDPDSEAFEHKFKPIVYAPEQPRPSVWTQGGWWKFLGIVAAMLALFFLLRAVL